jgi:isopentenyldiphosphate isomerase
VSGPDLITIVDDQDVIIGSDERKSARKKGLIHRIVKIAVFNARGELLIQLRSHKKEESPLKWDLSATGHVDAGEDYLEAARRETAEEIGISNVSLKYIGKYFYERRKGALTLRRFNAIYLGTTDDTPVINDAEIEQIRWISQDTLHNMLLTSPLNFTTSFTEIIERYESQLFSAKSR